MLRFFTFPLLNQSSTNIIKYWKRNFNKKTHVSSKSLKIKRKAIDNRGGRRSIWPGLMLHISVRAPQEAGDQVFGTSPNNTAKR